jgi:putative DNA primase/helicase
MLRTWEVYAWSHRVREPQVWLGRADPCETVSKVREDDPKRSALLTILLQWNEALGIGSTHTMREIINVAISRSDLFNALLAVAANRSGNVHLAEEVLEQLATFRADALFQLVHYFLGRHRAIKAICRLYVPSDDTRQVHDALEICQGRSEQVAE